MYTLTHMGTIIVRYSVLLLFVILLSQPIPLYGRAGDTVCMCIRNCIVCEGYRKYFIINFDVNLILIT